MRPARIATAVATTTVAAAALLAGPALCTALDVAGTAGSTTQSVVTTTQQTAGGAVSTVENTTQAAVQTAAPVVPTAAPAPAPTPTPAVQTQAAAPVRVSAPAQARTAPTVHTLEPNVASQQRASVSTPAASAARTVRTSAPAASHSHALTITQREGAGRNVARPSTRGPSSSCDGGALDALTSLLSAASGVDLVNLVCATGVLTQVRLGINLPATTGDVKDAPLSPVAALLTVVREQLSALHRDPRVLATSGHRYSRAGGSVRPNATAVVADHGVATRPSGFAPWADPSATHPVAAGQADQVEVAGTHTHGGLFGTPVTGTEAVFALLMADWALLVAVVMWRYRRRLLFPRAI